jgi:hypothetical protein
MGMDRLTVLENLVEELLKDKPEEKTIKQYFKMAGIEDSHDPLERIQEVLQALRFEEPEKEIQE